MLQPATEAVEGSECRDEGGTVREAGRACDGGHEWERDEGLEGWEVAERGGGEASGGVLAVGEGSVAVQAEREEKMVEDPAAEKPRAEPGYGGEADERQD